MLRTTLHYYYFNTRNADEQAAYAALSDRLKAEGLTLFDSISANHGTFYRDQIAPLDGQEIELETAHIFNSQWNTAPVATSEKGLRVFDWAEGIHSQSRSIKQGMYLDQTQEMRDIRNLTYKCGYCGKNYFKPSESFCTACIGSEYLTEKELPLLFLVPVANEAKRNYDGVNLPDGFIDLYRERHRETMRAKLQAAQARKLAGIEKEIESKRVEFEAFSLLIENDIDFDNCIYYSHTATFCFGWRQALSGEEQKVLFDKLSACGFVDKFKTEWCL
jgi:hypothetical protein